MPDPCRPMRAGQAKQRLGVLLNIWGMEEQLVPMAYQWRPSRQIWTRQPTCCMSCKNWRDIMLVSISEKVLNMIILKELKVQEDKRLRDAHVEFRKDRSCSVEVSCCLCNLCGLWESNEKAFNSVDREVLWRLLRHYVNPEKYIFLIQKTYERCTYMQSHPQRGSFGTDCDAHLSAPGMLVVAFVFLIAIDWIMRQTAENFAMAYSGPSQPD